MNETDEPILSTPIPQAVLQPPAGVSAGFWRRVGAWVVDMLILGCAGYTVGFALFARAVRFGPYGRFFGLALMLLYFGLLDSRIGGGRTAGKHLLGIMVVGPDGAPVSVARSSIRASLWVAPYILYGWALPLFFLQPAAAWCQSVIVVGLGGSIVYTIIFNRRTRQGFHDWLCRTRVERSTAPPPPVPVLPKLHIAVCIALLAFSVLAPALSTMFGPARWFEIELAPLLELHEKLSHEPHVFTVGVNHNVVFGTGHDVEILTVQAWYAGIPNVAARDDLIDRLARLSVTGYDRITQVTHVVIVVSWSFDLGVASWTNSYREARPVGEWRKRFQATQARGITRRGIGMPQPPSPRGA